MAFIGQYKRVLNAKKTVNMRRINKERMRHKLRLASFVDMPRLVKVPGASRRFANNPVFGTAYNG